MASLDGIVNRYAEDMLDGYTEEWSIDYLRGYAAGIRDQIALSRMDMATAEKALTVLNGYVAKREANAAVADV